MKKLLFPALLLFLYSCKKEKAPASGYNSYYHVSGSDTLSAVYIPNAFTPSGRDGINNYFTSVLDDCDNESYHMEIFNGPQKIYQTKGTFYGWDGMNGGIMAKTGRYSWHITVSDITGYQYDLQGEVYLLR